MTIMRTFFTVLYSRVNFMRTSLFCNPPNRLVSQFTACAPLPVKIVSIMLQPSTRARKARPRFLGMSVLFVVDMSHLKEDFLPFLTIPFFVQVSIQIVKQQRRVKTFHLHKQAFHQSPSAVPLDSHNAAF